MFEDLVFTIIEKTAPNFFPEILISPRAVSSQGSNHWGDAGSGDDGNNGEREWLLCCLQTLPSAWGSLPGWGLVVVRHLTRGWGTEQ